MKYFTALALLAGAAFAAPFKPEARAANAITTTTPERLKEALAKTPHDCWEMDPSEPAGWSTKVCSSTIEYCLRGWYLLYDEPFADDDACLRSRGLDPAKAVQGMRLASEDEYYAGFIALREANIMFNRHMLIKSLEYATASDREGNALIEQLVRNSQSRADRVRGAVEAAKETMKRAFMPGNDAKIDAAIDERLRRLEAAWREVSVLLSLGKGVVSQLDNMQGWFRRHSEVKYYRQWP